jgi:hypothetical protein
MTTLQAYWLGVMSIMTPSMLLAAMALWTLPPAEDD